MTSPDGRIVLGIDNAEKLSYSVVFDGRQLLADSPMGFDFKDEESMNGNFALLSEAKVTSSVEKWTPVVRNKHAECEVPYNEITLNLREKSGKFRRMDLEFRVMDDAVAFRYTLYGNMVVGNRQIVRELTSYSVPSESFLWVPKFEYNTVGYKSSQEGTFVKTPVKEISTAIHSGLPGLIKVDDSNWLAIMEADIDNYPGFYLGSTGWGSDGFVTLDTRLAPIPGEPEIGGVKARFFEKQSTPWRVVMIGHNPGKFIESEVLRSLNPDCAIKDPSWIKPGMSVWDHWWSGEVKMEMPVIKEYIDFASKEGWPYMIVDWTWYGEFCCPEADVLAVAPQLDMKEIIDYATERNVGIWLWMRSEDANNNDQYKEAFKQYHKWGVKGVKIDFMDRDDQDMINWYRRIIKEAAQNELMVDFHGAYKPDGIERTYPNMITREGVLGGEYYKWGYFKMSPGHNVTLAYTRLLAGQMDYTPGGFLNVTKEKYVQGSPTHVVNTRAQELAKFVVYESPLMVFCDHPSNVYGQVGEDFVSKVPVTWDDIRFLGGDPESYVAIAKRSGDRWYIGVLNNQQKRDISLDISSLLAGQCVAEMWTDGKNADVEATDCTHRTIKVDSTKPLKLSLATDGGSVVILSSAK